ncbi:MAG: acyl-CoA synthetase [Rickettsiales bacterium]|jgi:long-chain acyl-CoA synthetase|nr:acyl-CoA synthetase [Rickettsiales bacterium]|tara:strand:- start:352 stop:1878 length:1527 start_codon:yes stop_codon:yes gene_type:complete
MYPGQYAAETPNKAAAINAATGEILTYGELDARSAQLAHYLHSVGLRRGDALALNLENRLEFFVGTWAALRSGLYLITVNRYLPAHDVAYIIQDSGAKAIVTSDALEAIAIDLAPLIPNCKHRLIIGKELPGWNSFEGALAGQSTEVLEDERQGEHMPYSSGTTGRPKGIRRQLSSRQISEGPEFLETFRTYGFDQNSIYLSPAPLYHAAPFSFTNRTQVLGGTVVMMPRFDAEESLRLIEEHKVTHSQWVPTMFIRMLKLKEMQRSSYDLSTHQVAIHAAAPCPVEVKRRMIKWWGPILQEYYAASERNGSTRISSEEWLKKPGSVGKAVSGILRVCDEDGVELGPGEDGIVYFERDSVVFTYHNDPERTKEAQHPQYENWSTMGDIGHLDEDGYLFLTDRKSFMIISGGVNIYPQMIEDALCLHPKVADVAVIGVPNPDFGEEVKAIIQTADGIIHDEATKEELMAFSRERLASYMVPRSIDFREELPRLPTGKLYKKQLMAEFWS